MGTVSLVLPSDGDTIDAADVNVPLNAIAAVINGGIDSTNITDASIVTGDLADAAVTPAKILAGTGSLWPLQSWTPTWVNLTVGNGTQASKYIQVGKTVFYRLSFILGSTSSISGDVTFTLPVTSITYPGAAITQVIGTGNFSDTGTRSYNCWAYWNTTTTGILRVTLGSTGATGYVGPGVISSTVPHVWASTDEIFIQGFYEAA